MYQVETDHRIDGYDVNNTGGVDLMKLVDARQGGDIVTATRDVATTMWTITAADQTRTAGTRPEAIQAMVDLALEVCPGTGYSTLVPHGLPETP